MRIHLLLAFLAVLHRATGWVSISQSAYGGQIADIAAQLRGETTENVPVDYQQKLGYLWTLPEDTSDSRGLGGGIAWAWDPNLCDSIIDQFSEDFFFIPFITCDMLKASMHRSFASWSDNHKDINFVDVTEECAMMGTPNQDCELVELWVTALEGEVGDSVDRAATATPAYFRSGARISPVISTAASGHGFRYTNGEIAHRKTGSGAFESGDAAATAVTIDGGAVAVRHTARNDATGKPTRVYQVEWLTAVPSDGAVLVIESVGTDDSDGAIGDNVTLVGGWRFANPEGMTDLAVIETTAAVVSFNRNLCWYLDSTFCSHFHELKGLGSASPGSVLLGMQVALFSVFALSALVIGFQLFKVLSRTACHGGTLGEKLKKTMEEISKWSIIGLTVRLICLWSPPIAYMNVFLPCWDCYDFEGAATHEVGHVLGLSHPDAAADELQTGVVPAGTAPGENAFSRALSVARMNASSCGFPWDDVAAGVPAGAVLDAATGLRDSIMEAFTQHNPSVCLTDDDLEALNVLYPQCTYAMGAPVCFKTDYMIGWIRLFVWVGMPVIISLMFVMLLSAFVRDHQLKRLGSARNLIKQKSQEVKGERQKARRASVEAQQLAEALDMQIATEETRINERAQRLSVQMVAAHLDTLGCSNGESTPGSAGGAGGGAQPRPSECGRPTSCADENMARALASSQQATSRQTPKAAGGRKWLGGGGGLGLGGTMKRMASQLAQGLSRGPSSMACAQAELSGNSSGGGDAVNIGNLAADQPSSPPLGSGSGGAGGPSGGGPVITTGLGVPEDSDGGMMVRTQTMRAPGAGPVQITCGDRSSTGEMVSAVTQPSCMDMRASAAAGQGSFV